MPDTYWLLLSLFAGLLQVTQLFTDATNVQRTFRDCVFVGTAGTDFGGFPFQLVNASVYFLLTRTISVTFSLNVSANY